MNRAYRLRRRFAVFTLAVLATAAACAHAHETPVGAPFHGTVAPFARPDASPLERLAGRLEPLVVDDRVAGRRLTFPRLRLRDGSLLPLVGDALATLPASPQVTVDGRRNGKALEVVTATALDGAAEAVDQRVPARVAGTLLVLHADDFEHAQAQFHYRVETEDGSTTELAVDTLPAVLRSGMRVEVDGRAVAAGLEPMTIAVVKAAPERAHADAVAKVGGAHAVLVVMVNYSNTAAPAFTSVQAAQVMSTNSNSVANYYAESSYNHDPLNVTVTPTWVTMAGYGQPTCPDASLTTFTSAANAASKAAGYDPAAYEFVVYLFPSTSGCGWAGLGYIGYPKLAYVNGPSSFVTQVVAHEMGHNFGLLHAGSLRCSAASIGGTCSVSEYGDPFSTMGNQHPSHFNAVQKSLLGWIPTISTPTHPGGSVTYTLSPLENPGGSTYAVKIATPLSTRTYWLEYRQPIGFDAWSGWTSNGVQIRVASPFETYCPGCDGWSDDTELVDATPATTSFNDAALTVGNTYTDPAYPVSVQVLAQSASTLTVQVTTPSVASATTTNLASSQNPAPVGATVTLTATVTGNGPTGTVTFRDAGVALPACSGVGLSGTGNARTAACVTASLAAGSHTITAAYSGDASNSASTSTAVVQSITSTGWLGYLYGGNQATAAGSAVAAGSSNAATGQGAFVGAGQSNRATSTSALVLGGFDNQANSIDSVVGAGAGNRANGARSVVVGGGYNLASGAFSFIGGGGRDGTTATAAGTTSLDHIAAAKWSTIGGGAGNRAGNAAAQTGSTAFGGELNQASNTDATVAGGRANVASGAGATIGGGQSNAAAGTTSTVAGGQSGSAAGTSATVAGGNQSSAGGSFALALGQRASAGLTGAAALADGTALAFPSVAANEFAVRATGGVRLASAVDAAGAVTAGVTVPAGSGSWSSLSDIGSKRDVQPVAVRLLDALLDMPVLTWRYRHEVSGATHMGPTAQDFRAAFALGDSERAIATVDADGVALAAIQELRAALGAKRAAVAARAHRIEVLRARVEALEARIAPASRNPAPDTPHAGAAVR